MCNLSCDGRAYKPSDFQHVTTVLHQYLTFNITSHRLSRSFWRFFQPSKFLMALCHFPGPANRLRPVRPWIQRLRRFARPLGALGSSGMSGTGRHVAGIGAHKGLITITVGHVNWHLFEQDLKTPPELSKPSVESGSVRNRNNLLESPSHREKVLE